MAISVKNHEDRITELEKKNVSSAYSETILWSGSTAVGNWSNVNFTLSQNITNFHFLLIDAVTWRTRKAIVAPVSHIVTSYQIDVLFGGDSSPGGHRTFMLKRVNNTQINLAANDIDSARVYKITGIKFSNVILYYVSNIIYTKFKLRLNSVIAIFNRLFLHKFIIGGETWKWL